MIIVALLWILVFFSFTTFGYSVHRLCRAICKIQPAQITASSSFFLGFLTISAISGFLSIWIPINIWSQVVTITLSLLFFLINYKGIASMIKESFIILKMLSWPEIILLLIVVLFLISTAAGSITWGDTESYHVQTINWISRYAVVPGLGNIHERFAFNSMFFVISALFTFKIGAILIFPINGICFIVLIIKLFILLNRELKNSSGTKLVFYSMAILISILFLVPSINSPSPDTICGILITYLFVLFIQGEEKAGYSFPLLLNLIIFSCITFKLSSIFLITALFLVWDKNYMNNIFWSGFVGLFVFIPFVIRNYFLSGYLIYPFPAIDIFNVDWKVPFTNVMSMKLEIEGWAKMSSIPYPEVLNLRFLDWFLPWFVNQNFIGKVLLVINGLSLATFTGMIIKRDFLLVKVQLVILINLVFWLLTAPDIRFAYGFLFMGLSLTVAYVIKLIEISSGKHDLKILKLALLVVFIIVLGRRISYPEKTLIKPRQWVLPAPFGSVETEVFATNFQFRVPVQRGGCLNTEIPCVPVPFDNVFLRGNEIQDGFKVDTTVYSGIHYID